MRRVQRIHGKGRAFSRPKLIMPEEKPRKKIGFRTRISAFAAFIIVAIIAGSGIYSAKGVLAALSEPTSFAHPSIYPGAAILKTRQSTDCSNKPAYETTITSNDTNDAIKAFYKDKLNAEGWEGPEDLYGGQIYKWPKNVLPNRDRGQYEISIWFTGYSKKQISINSGFDRLCVDLTPVAVLATPSPTPPTININQQDYDAALAKWRESGIEEYELSNVVFSMVGSATTIRVNNRTGSILIKKSDADNFEDVRPQELPYFRSDTVEGMFEQVSQYLTKPASEGTNETTQGWHDGYEITFDPDLGYPVQIVGFPITDPGVWVSDSNWAKTVTEMKIISRR